jgi:hypothetical protein
MLAASRFRLINGGKGAAAIDSPSPTNLKGGSVTLYRKSKAPPTGQLLLSVLRWQSRRIGGRRFARHQAPELWDLSMAAAGRRGKFLRYCGIKFPLRHGIWVYVADPHSYDTLVAAHGGWL